MRAAWLAVALLCSLAPASAKPPSRLKIKYAAETKAGPNSRSNDDFFGIDDSLFVVAAGHGPRADVASKLAVETVIATYKQVAVPCPSDPKLDELENRLACAVRAGHKAVADAARRGSSISSMRASIVAVAFNDPQRVTCAYVGAARAYVVRGSQADYLTGDSPEVKVQSQPLRERDIVVLASDGLAAATTDEQLATRVRGPSASLDETAALLIGKARVARPADNFTVILLKPGR